MNDLQKQTHSKLTLNKKKRADVLKGANVAGIDGVFTEAVVLGMLQIKDYKNVDFVASSFGGAVKICCETSKTASVADAFTEYAGLACSIRKSSSHPGRTEQKLSTLPRQKY